MGQYYNVIVRRRVGGKFADTVYGLQTTMFNGSDFSKYNGLKLMEHSWWDNDFCRAFAETLVESPAKVCWCGDYAEYDECKSLGFNYKDVWNGDGAKKINVSKFKLDDVKFLVNKDKKEYVDLSEYKKKSTADGWCVFPISLLTALGNNRGGGDYHENGSCFELVGTWAFDEIYLTNFKPNECVKLNVYFKEAI